ncbi:hypothetical protein BGX28_009316 [Mortierella sp. GBA30]|nr:hypothetical protein BGX28_009316 [Mortierella sp. GBA30]
MTTFITSTQRRQGGKDEPDDLRQLRREHGNSLLTLKELFADWTEEDLLYAIQDAGGDVELAIVRISEGHASQWGEVKGKKKTPKVKTTSEKQDFRTGNQRGGFADRGSRGRDGFRGGRGGSTRGGPRAQNGGDRHTRPAKAAHDATTTSEPATSGLVSESIDGAKESTPSWADATAAAVDSSSSDATTGWGASTDDPWSSTTAMTDSTTTAAPATDAWGTSAESSTDAWGTSTTAAATSSTTDAWEAPVATPSATTTTTTTTPSTRKINTATIPAGSKMSWAKIVKPESAPKPVPVAPPKSIPAPASAPPAQKATKHAEPLSAVAPEPEAVIDHVSEPTPAVETEVKAAERETVESVPVSEQRHKEPAAAELVPEPKPEQVQAAASSPAATAATPVGPPGLKQKPVAQPRRLNQEAPVVMPGGSASLQSVGVKFGSFSLNDDVEHVEPEARVESSSQQTATSTQPTPQPQPSQPAQPAQATQSSQPAQPSTQQQAAYGRQPSAPTGVATYQGATPTTSGQSPASANASYLKQEPGANYLGQHHHHPGMGHDAMGSPYGSYMPAANQLGSFGMPPMATLPNDYAALYGSDIQRAMYYDPANYGQMPTTGANTYQTRDSKYNQDTAATASTTGAASTSSTQAQQTLQQQQQQQQAYPNMAGGLPYYPYYYMAPNQFPNAYQQSGYGQPFVNKNMYPMYQHQQPQPQQHSSNKPGSSNTNTSYGNFGTAGAGQGGHHQYSQSGYDDMSGAGLHGLSNDPYAKYGNAGVPNYLAGQQQAGSTGASASTGGKSGNAGASGNYAEKTAGAGGSQASSNTPGGVSHQSGGANQYQGQQGYYQQQMFSNYQQYPSHHQGYHPNPQHQGQHHQGSGRNSNSNQQQQFWSQN